MSNILILTASIGNGHNQIAQNLQQILSTTGCNVTTIDFLEVSPHDVNNFFSKAYKNLLKYKPDVFRQICRLSGNDSLSNVKYMLAKINRRIIAKLAQQYQPDIIICTHFFPLAAAAAYKKKYHPRFKLAGLVTDYTIHPIWQLASVDQYFVAHPSLVKQFHTLPPGTTQILPTGIPVGTGFVPALRSSNFHRILVMTSHQTTNSMESIITALQGLPISTLVTFITGNELRRQLELEQLAKKHKNFEIIGFTTQVSSFMKSCDLLITKPGGSTLTEALATGTPLIVFSPIPGIEEDNARFLEENQVGYWARTATQLIILMQRLLHHPLERQQLSQRMLSLEISQASKQIQQVVLSELEVESQVAL
jgi:processive 1,2-diacylglycerol beta-glucosyltransferase